MDNSERIEAIRDFGAAPTSPRPLLASMLRGARGKCPNCGRGTLFQRYLGVKAGCERCGEAFHHHRADDLPIYLNIFLTGHAAIGLVMLVIDSELLPLWAFTLLTMGAAVTVSIALMRPLKGLVIGAQWALLMHGFGGHDD